MSRLDAIERKWQARATLTIQPGWINEFIGDFDDLLRIARAGEKVTNFPTDFVVVWTSGKVAHSIEIPNYEAIESLSTAIKGETG